MRILFSLSVLAIFMGCSQDQSKPSEGLSTGTSEVFIPEFNKILDSTLCIGSILIYNPDKEAYYSNDFNWAKKGFLPASTFKITNSIIALETGIIENDSTVLRWNGEPRRLDIWNQDLIFRDAFHLSCVPCYQEIAREIGSDRMNSYLNSLNYGHMAVDSASIDLFWLEGNSMISQFEQIDYLERFNSSQLPITERTKSIMKRLMVIDETQEYKISGKTGWSIRNGRNNGWFVGYIENNKGLHYFALNIIPEEEFNLDLFPKIRNELAFEAFKHLEIVQ